MQRLVGSKRKSKSQEPNVIACLVTTVPWSFYHACLTSHPIKPLNHLLEVSSANGQPVPYKGYVEIPITFPEDMVGSEVEISTLALVVPERLFWFSSNQKNSLKSLSGLTLSFPCMLNVLTWIAFNTILHDMDTAVLKTLELRHKPNVSGCLGLVRLQSKEPIVIPAQQTVALCGKVNVNCLPSKPPTPNKFLTAWGCSFPKWCRSHAIVCLGMRRIGM